MDDITTPIRPSELKKNLHYAGFQSDEITDIFDTITRHSKALASDHAFFNFAQSIQFLMADNSGMAKDYIIARLASEPSPLFALYGLPFPANANPRKITLNATPRAYQYKAETKTRDKPKDKPENEIKAEKPPLKVDLDGIHKTMVAIVEASPNRIRPGANEKGLIQHGPMAGKYTLAAINSQLRDYGLHNPDCGFNSLATYLEHHQIGIVGSRKMPRCQELNGSFRIAASDIVQEIDEAIARTGSSSLTAIFSEKRIETLNEAFARGHVTGLADIPEIRALPVTRPEEYIRNIQNFLTTVRRSPSAGTDRPKDKPSGYPERRWG